MSKNSDRCMVSQRPDLIKEWDFELNKDLSPDEISIGSNKKAWWKCEKGHSWDAVIANRSRSSGCPYCSGRKVCDDNCLSTLFPLIAKEWDYEKNDNLSPETVTCGSNKKVWWKCEKGHSWKATIASRVSGCRCPICQNRRCLKGYNDLKSVCPDLMKEWDYEKNVNIQPDEIVYSTETKVWWICEKKHSWKATVYSRTSKSQAGCPYCSGIYTSKENSLATCFPRIAELWDYEKNNGLIPENVAKFSGKRVFWKCAKGHEWAAIISDLTALELGCPFCSGKRASEENNLAFMFPELLEEWDYEKNIDISPEKILPHSQKKVWWKCSKGHSWNAVVGNRTTNGAGCPLCNNKSTSFPEQAVFYYIEKVFTDAISRDVEAIGAELDIYIPSIRTAIEYDGFRWHNSQDVRRREIKKDQLCISKSIKLIRIIEAGLDNFHNDEVYCVYVKKNNHAELENTIRDILHRVAPSSSIVIDLKKDISRIKEKYIQLERENSLGVRYPGIASEWDCEENEKLTPYMFSSGSNHKAWWKCTKGHKWQAAIVSRITTGSGCPYCAKKLASKDYNLEAYFPDISKEWDYEKNGDVLPSQMTPYTNKKVWWKCEKNHEWIMAISHRTKDNCNCPYCSGRRVSEENNLSVLYPEIAMEWDYSKNGELSPRDITRGSTYSAWWKCSKGHSYDMQVVHRTNMGYGCPYCAGKRVAREESLGVLFPDLLEEWDFAKNIDITPFEILPYSSKKVWWRCENNHSYNANVSNKVANNTQCSYCSGRKVCVDNCLSTTCPEVAEQWNYEKNGEVTPNDVTKGSHMKIWWKCPKGHEWEDMVYHRTRTKNHPCPICMKRSLNV
ncbi:MAG: zinc-ribbon domain-containing protein [Lachnospiraceae bacterium]|nr:zinc-ribbon domain-containing protein [Lachnospiraceae bacterium]